MVFFMAFGIKTIERLRMTDMAAVPFVVDRLSVHKTDRGGRNQRVAGKR